MPNLRLQMCLLGPTDRTVSRESDTSAETGGARVPGSGRNDVPVDYSGELERKHTDVVERDE
jgi:hypothetical protein